jgi:serine/threonine protein kinase
LVKSLGAGYNAKVKLGYDAQTQQYHAIKIFKKTHSFEKNRDSLKKEYQMMKHLNHPNLINLVEIKEEAEYLKKNGQSYKTMAIAIEYAHHGELFEYVA